MLVKKGYALMETRLDAEAEDAIRALADVMQDTRLWMEFTIGAPAPVPEQPEVAHFRSGSRRRDATPPDPSLVREQGDATTADNGVCALTLFFSGASASRSLSLSRF
jgi:hypothetical protein